MSLTPPLFIACAKPGKWVAMYLWVRSIGVATFYDFPLDFGTVPTVWYIFVFILGMPKKKKKKKKNLKKKKKKKKK